MTQRNPTKEDIFIAIKLKQAMRKAGCSQEKLAKHLGISYQQVGKYCNGQNRISAGRLAIVVNFLEVPIGHFYDALIDIKEAA